MSYNPEVFEARIWGRTYADDKYFSNEELEDDFITFFYYTFAHLNLPAPSKAQLEMAHFISNREHNHKIMMAMRGLA